MENSMIVLEGITKVYQMGTQEVHALRGVDLTIEDGAYLAIMGPSGSGKSTLMNIMGCLDIPTAGRYILNGEDVSRLSDDQQARIRSQQIGFVFQQFNLLPRTKAIKQVSTPLMYAGCGRQERYRRAAEALRLVGLEDRLDHRPDELSGGQQQRVAIARALVTRPALILADEPTGNLDSETGAELLELLGQLNRQGMTIVTITHDPVVAGAAKRTIHIRDGLIERDEKRA